MAGLKKKKGRPAPPARGPVLYSRALEAAKKLPEGGVQAQSLLNIIKKNGAPEAELRFTGVEKLTQGVSPTSKVPRDAVEEAILQGSPAFQMFEQQIIPRKIEPFRGEAAGQAFKPNQDPGLIQPPPMYADKSVDGGSTPAGVPRNEFAYVRPLNPESDPSGIALGLAVDNRGHATYSEPMSRQHEGPQAYHELLLYNPETIKDLVATSGDSAFHNPTDFFPDHWINVDPHRAGNFIRQILLGNYPEAGANSLFVQNVQADLRAQASKRLKHLMTGADLSDVDPGLLPQLRELHKQLEKDRESYFEAWPQRPYDGRARRPGSDTTSEVNSQLIKDLANATRVVRTSILSDILPREKIEAFNKYAMAPKDVLPGYPLYRRYLHGDVDQFHGAVKDFPNAVPMVDPVREHANSWSMPSIEKMERTNSLLRDLMETDPGALQIILNRVLDIDKRRVAFEDTAWVMNHLLEKTAEYNAKNKKGLGYANNIHNAFLMDRLRSSLLDERNRAEAADEKASLPHWASDGILKTLANRILLSAAESGAQNIILPDANNSFAVEGFPRPSAAQLYADTLPKLMEKTLKSEGFGPDDFSINYRHGVVGANPSNAHYTRLRDPIDSVTNDRELLKLQTAAAKADDGLIGRNLNEATDRAMRKLARMREDAHAGVIPKSKDKYYRGYDTSTAYGKVAQAIADYEGTDRYPAYLPANRVVKKLGELAGSDEGLVSDLLNPDPPNSTTIVSPEDARAALYEVFGQDVADQIIKTQKATREYEQAMEVVTDTPEHKAARLDNKTRPADRFAAGTTLTMSKEVLDYIKRHGLPFMSMLGLIPSLLQEQDQPSQ